MRIFTKKKLIGLLIFCLLVLILSFSPSHVFAEELDDVTEKKFEEIDFGEFEKALEEIEKDIFFEGSFKEFVKSLLGGKQIEGQKFFDLATNVIFASVKVYIPYFSTILAILIAFGVLTQIKDGYLSDQVKNIINIVLMISIMLVIMLGYNKLILDARETMEGLKKQMYSAFPIIITLLTGIGAHSTAVSMQPILYFLSVIISDIIMGVVFPIFLFSMAINLIMGVSVNIKLQKLSEFLKTLSKYLIGITLTIFTACIAISGITAGMHDSVMYKTAKYAVGNSVPMIGGYLKDGMDVIIISGLMLKNSIGVASLILFLVTALSPIVSIFIFSLLLKLVTALSESFVSDKVGAFLSSTTKSVSEIGVALLAVTYMFFISVLALLLAGNSFL